MNIFLKAFFGLAATMFLPSVSYAGNVDIANEINARLSSLGHHPLHTTCRNHCAESKKVCRYWEREWREGGGDKIRTCVGWDHICTRQVELCDGVASGSLTAASASTIVESLRFGEPRKSQVADRWIRQTVSIPNCSTVPQNVTKTMSLSYQDGHSINMSETVTNGSSSQIGINTTFRFSGATVGLSGSYTVHDSISVSNQTGKNHSETINVSTNANIVAIPRAETSATISVLKREYVMSFEGTLLVDGPLVANLTEHKRISDVLDEANRRFSVRGEVTASFGSEDSVSYNSVPLNCESHEKLEPFIGNQVEYDMEAMDKDMSLLLSPPADDKSDENQLVGYSFKRFLSNMQMAGKPMSSNSEKINWVLVQGSHQCQSRDSIGHLCSVFGQFSNCNAGRISLTAEDCCSKTSSGGVSIGFTPSSCTPF